MGVGLYQCHESHQRVATKLTAILESIDGGWIRLLSHDFVLVGTASIFRRRRTLVGAGEPSFGTINLNSMLSQISCF